MSEAARQNRILASLPAQDLKRWAPHLQAVKLTRGDVLHEPGMPEAHAYFPTCGVISLTYEGAAGETAEIGMVGNEGMIGASLSTSEFDAGPPSGAVVQSDGWAFRFEARRLQADLERRAVWELLWRHSQALMTQMAQTASCIRHHAIEQQFCRWLLLCLDRSAGAELTTTQATIAAKLGVRRAGINECLRRLQEEGTIRSARGLVVVLERARLEQRACGCYEVIRKEYRRLMQPEGAA